MSHYEQRLQRDLDDIHARFGMTSTDARRTLHQAICAFAEENGEVARATMHLADTVEHTMGAIYEALLGPESSGETRDRIALFVVFNMLSRPSTAISRFESTISCRSSQASGKPGEAALGPTKHVPKPPDFTRYRIRRTGSSLVPVVQRGCAGTDETCVEATRLPSIP